MTDQEKEIKKICKALGIEIPAEVVIPSEEELDNTFEKLYAADYFDDVCELIHTREGFEKGYLTSFVLATLK